jgi:hypothetical protein
MTAQGLQACAQGFNAQSSASRIYPTENMIVHIAGQSCKSLIIVDCNTKE